MFSNLFSRVPAAQEQEAQQHVTDETIAEVQRAFCKAIDEVDAFLNQEVRNEWGFPILP